MDFLEIKFSKKNEKPKIEFSKIVVATFFIASIVFTALSYVLAFCGLNTVEGLSQVIVKTSWTVSGISFFAYAGQNGIRAWSKNKWFAKEQIKNSGNGADTYGGYYGDMVTNDYDYMSTNITGTDGDGIG